MLRRISLTAFLFSFLFTSFILPQKINIEGTYHLVIRKLADGTRISDPDIYGLMTFTKTDRNFNIVYKDKEGKLFSYSLISKYKLTDGEYSETLVYSLLNDEQSGKGLNYLMEEKTETMPVKSSEGKLEVKMPFDPVTITFTGDRIVAVGDNFTDYWEKIEE
jgi:hypothetical protein